MNGINTRQEKVTIVIAHIIMILLAVLAIAPFWLLVSSSLQEESSIREEGYSFLPKHMSAFDEAIDRSIERTAVVKITLTESPTGKRKLYDIWF